MITEMRPSLNGKIQHILPTINKAYIGLHPTPTLHIKVYLPKPIKEDSSKYWIINKKLDIFATKYKQCTQYIMVDSAIAISCLLSTVISCATTDTMLHT